MDELTSLIRVLKNHEIRLIRTFYQGNVKYEKRLQLFDLVRKKSDITDKKAMQKLYGTASKSAYRALKRRLKDDILRLLLLQDGTKAYETDYLNAQFECLQKFLAGRLLQARGNYKTAVNTLQQAEEIADRFNLPLEQILIDDILRTHLGYKEGIEKYQSYTLPIKANLQLAEDILQARSFYHQLLLPTKFKANIESKYKQFAKRASKDLEQRYERTNNPQVGYWYYYITVYYFITENEYKKAFHFADKMLRLLKNHQSIYSSSRVGGGQMLSAGLLLYLNDFDRSKTYAKTALEHFKSGLINEFNALTLLFYAHFYKGELKQAKKLIQQALEHPQIDANEVYQPKWRFFEANCLFVENDFHHSLLLLNQNSSLMKDKSGWLLGYRLLEILNLIELEEYDAIYDRLHSLDKLLQRQKEQPIDRFKLIAKLLKKLSRSNYNYDEIVDKEEATLALLQKGEDEYRWTPYEYELIRFDKWLMLKAKDKILQSPKTLVS